MCSQPSIDVHFFHGRAWTVKASVVKSPDPYERIVELRVNGLEIFEDQLLVQHAFVERQREARVDELAVEKCLQRRNERGVVSLGRSV